MALTNFTIVAQQFGAAGSLIVSADHGKKRISALIERVSLDDYFENENPHLSPTDRYQIVEKNQGAIGDMMLKKWSAGAQVKISTGSGLLEVVVLDLADLRSGPPLKLNREEP